VKPNRNPWLALLVLCLGFFVILLDTTIVNVAIPTMVDSLHASLDQILWVLNAYLLTLAVLIVTSGRVGDIVGQRNMFVAGLGLFTAASAACGLSTDANQLIVARIVQGVGAAVLSPQALVVVSAIFPAARRGAALGIMGAVTALAAVAGPIAGGLIVTYLDWRWIFFVNLPIGLLGIALALWLVPDIRSRRRNRLDLVGVVLATAGLFAIVFGLIEGQRYSWGAIAGTALTIPEVIGAGILILAAFVAWERSQAEPLMPLTLFRNRDYSVATFLTGLQFFGMFGFFLTTTIYLQSVLGMSAIQAGLTTLPLSLAIMATSPIAGRVTDRIGGRYILMAGCLLFGAGIGGVAIVESLSSTSWTFALPLAVSGVGAGCMIAPIMTVAMHRIEPAMAGAASGILNTSRQVGAAIGAAVVGAVLQNQLATAMHDRAVTDSLQLPPAFRQRFIDGVAGAASNGFDVGRGQNGVAQVQAGLPPQTAHLLQQLVHDVFVNGYVTAMRPTLVVPVIGFIIGAGACLVIGRRSALGQVGASRAEFVADRAA
jgi:EmrB/QacA subfamily drug resistance transporter